MHRCALVPDLVALDGPPARIGILRVADRSEAGDPSRRLPSCRAGNQLGITTVQVLRAGVPRGNNASHYIDDLAELKGLLRQY